LGSGGLLRQEEFFFVSHFVPVVLALGYILFLGKAGQRAPKHGKLVGRGQGARLAELHAAQCCADAVAPELYIGLYAGALP
jgi:hypothetical protein